MEYYDKLRKLEREAILKKQRKVRTVATQKNEQKSEEEYDRSYATD